MPKPQVQHIMSKNERKKEPWWVLFSLSESRVRDFKNIWNDIRFWFFTLNIKWKIKIMLDFINDMWKMKTKLRHEGYLTLTTLTTNKTTEYKSGLHLRSLITKQKKKRWSSHWHKSNAKTWGRGTFEKRFPSTETLQITWSNCLQK